MIATSALTGQPPKLAGVSPSVNAPAKATPFQLDAGPLGISKPTAPAAAAPQADVKTVVGALASITQLLSILTTKSTDTPLINANSNKPPAGGFASASGNGAGPGGGPVTVDGTTIPDTLNTTKDATQKAKLDATLAKVANDPEGSKLLQKAIANGYTIEVGDPSINPKNGQKETEGGGVLNGNTFTDSKKIIINPNAENFDKTVVHELVHAATDDGGDSQREEGLADVIGYRVSSRMNGTTPPLSEQQIYDNKVANYKDLDPNNNIDAALAALGIKGFST